MNADVMNRENPLLVVNNRLSLNRGGPESGVVVHRCQEQSNP